MIYSNMEDFKKAIRGGAESYGKNLSEDGVSHYWQLLADCSLDSVKWGLRQWGMHENKYFPKPSELYAIVKQSQKPTALTHDRNMAHELQQLKGQYTNVLMLAAAAKTQEERIKHFDELNKIREALAYWENESINPGVHERNRNKSIVG